MWLITFSLNGSKIWHKSGFTGFYMKKEKDPKTAKFQSKWLVYQNFGTCLCSNLL